VLPWVHPDSYRVRAHGGETAVDVSRRIDVVMMGNTRGRARGRGVEKTCSWTRELPCS
jgi:hypothetical protein